MARELIAPTREGASAVDDLHVGVISTDMGTHGYTLQTCSNPASGDNGVLFNTGRIDGCEPAYSAPDCEREECPWLSHLTWLHDDGTDPDNPPIWEDFRCIAALGTGGCGFAQPLEASYRALVENTAPGMPNEGFLRDDSVLVVIYVSDDDDCSTPNPEMFDPGADDLGPLGVRFALDQNEGLLHPISRYHDAFVELRDGNADRIVVAAIAGIPIDGSWNHCEIDTPGSSCWNPANPVERLTSCETVMGSAFPPIRIADLVSVFGDNGVLASICTTDLAP